MAKQNPHTLMYNLCKPQKPTPTDEELSKISSYSFLSWLQNSPALIFAANQLNYYHEIPMVNQYKIMKTMVGNKSLYIENFKKKGTSIETDEIIARHFNINMNKAKEYQELLGPEETQNIVDMYYGINVKDMI